jgi:type III secretion system FlhB-like substrate exporter
VCEANLVGGRYPKTGAKNERIHIFDNMALIEVLLRHILQDKVNSSTFRKSILIPNLVEDYT